MNDKGSIYTAISHNELLGEEVYRWLVEFQGFEYEEMQYILSKYAVIEEMQNKIIKAMKLRVAENDDFIKYAEIKE